MRVNFDKFIISNDDMRKYAQYHTTVDGIEIDFDGKASYEVTIFGDIINYKKQSGDTMQGFKVNKDGTAATRKFKCCGRPFAL